MFSTFRVQAISSGTTVTVTGDTSVALGPGWLFNADASTATPFEFNTNMPSIGSGSLEVFPIGADALDKFIGTYIEAGLLSDVSSISYDFKIAGSGDSTDANEFYLNVYTLASPLSTNYYDCRFDYIPPTGSTSSFTTFTADLSADADVVVTGSGYGGVCPTSPDDMPDGSILGFFALNLGDTSANDEGVGGFFDNVVVERANETTTYDFESGEVLGDVCEVGPGWAHAVVDYSQGTSKNGSAVADSRSDAEDSLDEPDGVFYSLGVDGWLAVEFNGYVVDEDGDDLSFHEVTNGRASYPLETLDVEVSQNGSDWYPAGSVTNQDGGDGVGYVDFASTGLEWVKYVRVTETTDFSIHSSGADGYDIDAFDATYIVCEEPEPRTVSVLADKVVCVAESFLPNWGGGGPNVTPSTATDFIAANEEACRLIDWDFQWAPGGTSNPGDEVGEAGDPWVTFADEAVVPTVVLGDTDQIRVREVFDDSWVPFSGANKTQDVSAEIYCHTDVLNYDNFDYIRNVEGGETYNCVGFNAPAPYDCEVGRSIFQIGDDEENQTDNPMDEFSWNGVSGDWSRPMDDPFEVPFSPDERFPWNSNYNKGEATDFEITFYLDSENGIPEAQLTLAWSPGASGTETKEVYLDGEMVDTITRVGTSTGGWYDNMEVFDDTFNLGYLAPGWHTLRLTQTEGNGTLWDWVGVEAAECDWDNQIQGIKFTDWNGDGQYNGQDRNRSSRINEWPIYLFDSEMEQIDMMYTGDDDTDAGNVSRGQYRFANLEPGTYYVCEGQQEGWVQTHPSSGAETEYGYCYEVEIEGNGDHENRRRFGNFELGEVLAWKFQDDNQNSQFDENEEYIDWRFSIYTDEWEPVYDQGRERVLIDDDQDDEYEPWSMPNLNPGSYIVCEWQQAGWVQSLPFEEAENVGMTQNDEYMDYCYYVTIDYSGEDVNVLFGNYPVGMVQGRKYHDVNANGQFDQEERQADGNVNRLDGWTINIYDPEWNLVDSMETGDDSTEAGNVGQGQYRFENLPLGTYHICEVQQDPWVQTQPADGVQQNDDDSETFCHTVTLDEPGESRTGRRFGNYEPVAEILGLVYNDESDNQVQDGSEAGINEWDVWLLTRNSPFTIQAIYKTDTSNTGQYSFGGLAYGTYYVCQDIQSGWAQTQTSRTAVGVDPADRNVGDVLDLDDDDVADYCYEIELTADNPVSADNVFGNHFAIIADDSGGQVQGITTDGPATIEGQVLGASDGDVLAETGTGILTSAVIGSVTFLAATGLAFVTRPRRSHSA